MNGRLQICARFALLAFVLLSLPNTARAETVGLAPVQGNATDERRDNIRDAIRESLTRLGHRPRNMRRGFDAESDVQAIARRARADWIVAAEATPLPGQYQLSLRVGRASDGRAEQFIALIRNDNEAARLDAVLGALLREEGIGDDAFDLAEDAGPEAAPDETPDEAPTDPTPTEAQAAAQAAIDAAANAGVTEPGSEPAEVEPPTVDPTTDEGGVQTPEEPTLNNGTLPPLDQEAATTAPLSETSDFGAPIGTDPALSLEDPIEREERGTIMRVRAGLGIAPLVVSNGQGGVLVPISGRFVLTPEGFGALSLRAGADVVLGASSGLGVVIGGAFTPRVSDSFSLGGQAEIGTYLAFSGSRSVSFLARAAFTLVIDLSDTIDLAIAAPEFTFLAPGGIGIGGSAQLGVRF